MRHLPPARLIALALLISLVTACVHPQLYRPRTVAVAPDGQLLDAVCEPSDQDNCADAALVRRSYRYADKVNEYYTAFVEFDDQGWFWDRKQMEVLLRLLYQHGQARKDEFLIVLYAHGWQHNAGACDSNVVCFQRILERFDVLERQGRGTPRKVVGVYVGWRGRSISEDFSIVDKLSFWQRKDAALRVGNGGVEQLLAMLNEFREYKNPERDRTKTQLLITGHSFGGQVVFTAIKNLLVHGATRLRTDDSERLGYEPARGVGDLIVLVNPAFEGSMYEPLHDAAVNRCFPESQRPALMIVTSETDYATRYAFPIGRWFNTRLQAFSAQRANRAEGDAIVKTVGHLDRYRTHTLSLVHPDADRRESGDADAPCGCPLLSPIGEYDVEADKAFIRKVQETSRAVRSTGRSEALIAAGEAADTLDYYYGENIKLTRETPSEDNASGEYAPNYPYLVIRAKPELIRDHGDIYDEDFVDFVRRFYLRHVNERVNFPAQCFRDTPACIPTDITPCERSCRRRDGASCSDRPGLGTR